jgi:hypothetical protein
MIFRAPHHEEVAPVLGSEVLLHLPYEFTGVQVNDFKVGMAIHSERLPPAKEMVNNIDRKAGIERPDVNSVGIHLRVQNKVVLPSLLFFVADQISLLSCFRRLKDEFRSKLSAQRYFQHPALHPQSRRRVLFSSERHASFLTEDAMSQAYFDGWPAPNFSAGNQNSILHC